MDVLLKYIKETDLPPKLYEVIRAFEPFEHVSHDDFGLYFYDQQVAEQFCEQQQIDPQWAKFIWSASSQQRQNLPAWRYSTVSALKKQKSSSTEQHCPKVVSVVSKPKEAKLLATLRSTERAALRPDSDSGKLPIPDLLKSKAKAVKSKVLQACLQLLMFLGCLSPRYNEVFGLNRAASQAELDYLDSTFLQSDGKCCFLNVF